MKSALNAESAARSTCTDLQQPDVERHGGSSLKRGIAHAPNPRSRVTRQNADRHQVLRLQRCTERAGDQDLTELICRESGFTQQRLDAGANGRLGEL